MSRRYAYANPGPYALIVWDTTGDIHAHWTYHRSRAAALAAAPRHQASTVVDATAAKTTAALKRGRR